METSATYLVAFSCRGKPANSLWRDKPVTGIKKTLGKGDVLCNFQMFSQNDDIGDEQNISNQAHKYFKAQ